MFDLVKLEEILERKKPVPGNIVSYSIFPKYSQAIIMTMGYIATKFCSDCITCSHFVAQTSIFMNATAAALG